MGRIRTLQSRALTAAGALAAVLCGCASHTVRVVDMTPPQQFDTATWTRLCCSMSAWPYSTPTCREVFEDQLARNITPEVRRAEANYMAYFAKNLLQSTGNWGAVRVVPARKPMRWT